MGSREDIEKLEVDALEDVTPATRTLIKLLRTLLLELFTVIETLRTELATRNAELAALRGPPKPTSERRPRPKPQPITDDEKAERRRREKAARDAARAGKETLPTTVIPLPHSGACPTCASHGPFEDLPPEVSFQVELVPAHLVRRRFETQRSVCPNGHLFTGPRPVRVGDCSHYGPALHAEVTVSKATDAMPVHRLARRLARAGLQLSRSALNDLWHRSAELLRPIYERLLETVKAATYVNADETSQPVMAPEHCRNGFIWTFIADRVIAYVFSASRSGETPQRLLGDSKGRLQIDGSTGYNIVLTPERRTRDGCLAHVRRYFVKALDTARTEADHAISVIAQLYAVEYEAALANLLGTPAHRELRQTKSKPLLEAWKHHLETLRADTPPKSPLGAAIRYTLNQWTYVTHFLDDPLIRLDNNISEAALRIIALGRDTFKWVGNDDAGEHLAIIHTIAATCALNKINPNAYVADVIVRVATHPAAKLDDLLPWNWAPEHATP